MAVTYESVVVFDKGENCFIITCHIDYYLGRHLAIASIQQVSGDIPSQSRHSRPNFTVLRVRSSTQSDLLHSYT